MTDLEQKIQNFISKSTTEETPSAQLNKEVVKKTPPQKNLLKIIKKISGENKTAVVFLVLFVLGFFYTVFISAPKDFPVSDTVEIKKGSNLTEIADILKRDNVIRSAFLFKVYVRLFEDQTKAKSGEYFFGGKRDTISIAKIIMDGDYGLELVRVVIYEGSTIDEIAEKFSKKLDNFDAKEFKQLAKDKEGYLFPDTYLLPHKTSASEVVKIMEDNFDNKIMSVYGRLIASGKDLKEIITMASLLEEEARTFESKRIISGILWHRIDIDMPLQVDAVFPYIIGKNTYQVTKEDLKVDSKYNTYKYKGLPPGPISNPGLESIKAAIDPIKTNYIFYLSDREGNMYYAITYEEHKNNARLHLN